MHVKNEIRTLKIAELMGYSDNEYSFLVPEYHCSEEINQD